MMKFSVLLSIYNKENPAFLKQSLGSILNQSLMPNELILVKDGPLPIELDQLINIYAIQYSYLISIVELPKNQGLGKALNEGLKYCSYDLVARMDTDDIAKPERFEKQLRVFEEYPELDVVGSWIDEFEGEVSNVSSIRKLPEFQTDILKFAKQRNPINHPVVMFRKSAVVAVGGYKHFPLFEDYYLWVRMLINGARFYNIQESLLYFRLSPDMFKRRGGWNYAKNELKLQKEFKRVGFINKKEFIKNILIRFISRIIPNKLRAFIYKNILRK